MKKPLIAGLALLAAAIPVAASAATVQGVASYNGSEWVISWDGVAPACAMDFFAVSYASLAIRVDDVDYAVTQNGMAIDAANDRNSVTLPASVPNGAFQSFTINGLTALPCDGHVLLMPVAPTPVPTLSEWAMVLLGLIMAGGASLMIARRKASA